MNITVRQDANDETRRFAEWLQTDEAAPAFKNMAGPGKALDILVLQDVDSFSGCRASGM